MDLGYCPKNDVWNMTWLMQEYTEKVINVVIHQSWAIDEMYAMDLTAEEYVEFFWKDYPDWAEKYLEDSKAEAICYE